MTNVVSFSRVRAEKLASLLAAQLTIQGCMQVYPTFLFEREDTPCVLFSLDDAADAEPFWSLHFEPDGRPVVVDLLTDEEIELDEATLNAA
jgi:hypothetical protein